MDLLIYKPGRPILYEDKEGYDTSGWSAEIKGFIHLLEKLGHRVNIVSETDNEKYKFHMVPQAMFVFNGLFEESDYELINSYPAPKILCVTDLSILPTQQIDDVQLIIGQAPDNTRISKDLHIDLHYPFYAMMCMNYEKRLREKTMRYVFGGNERGRLKKIIEYVHRPGTSWFGKSAFLGFRRKIPFKEMQEVYDKTKYSIVLADEDYEKKGFITQRYFELLCNDVIAFVDEDYDKNNMIINDIDVRRVENYMELYDKMRIFDEDHELYDDTLRQQRAQILDYDEGKMLLRTKKLMGMVKDICTNYQ